MTDTPTEIRLAMRANGYDPLPACRKEVLLTGWSGMVNLLPEKIASWAMKHPQWTSTGNNARNTPGLDLDIKHPEAADAAEEMVREWFDGSDAEILPRFGEAPKRLIPFRTAQPFAKILVKLKAPDGSGHRIEMLGAGQQYIVAGVHPDTKRPYAWHADRAPWNVPRTDLPEIDEADARELIGLIVEMLRERFGFEIAPDEPRANGHDTGATSADEPVDMDAELLSIVDGASANAAQCRIIPSQLRKGFHPDDVLKDVAEATITMAKTHGLDWTLAREVSAVRKRVLSAYNNLLLKDYDPSTGLVPDWLPGEFHEAWIARLETGRKPIFGFNASGFYIRTAQASGDSAGDPQGKPGTGEDTGNAKAEDKSDKSAKQSPPKSEPRFRLLRFSDMRPGAGDQDYLVDELLPKEGLIVVWGKFKCLKTFWTYDLMLHVAKGWEYRDRVVKQGLVIYCAFEGAHGFHKRTEALRRHYKLPDDDNVPLRVMPAQMNLVADHKRFVADIRGQLGKDENPAVVVLDTLNRSLVGSESKDADMSAYIAAANAIREAFHCLVIIVHHCGWDETRPRGHSSLPAAIEGQIAITRQQMHITALVEFLRDGPEGAEIHCVTKIIEVGQDQNGKPVTSLIVTATDEMPRGAGPWPKALVIFRQALANALTKHGEEFQENIMEPSVRAVSAEWVRTEFYEIYPAKGDSARQRQDTKKHQYSRCLERAQIEGLIQIREPKGRPQLVWFATHTAPFEGE